MGFRMDGINCRPIPHDENGNLFSEQLGLTLKQEGARLYLTVPETGLPVPSLDTEGRRADEPTLRAKEAEARAERRSHSVLRKKHGKPLV